MSDKDKILPPEGQGEQNPADDNLKGKKLGLKHLFRHDKSDDTPDKGGGRML